MVATRQGAARRGQQGTPAGGGGGSPAGAEPAGSGKMAAAEPSMPVSVRMTRRRTKSVCKPEVIKESQLEELEHAETRSNVRDSLEMEITRNENTTVHAVQSVAEPQADEDVSEAESNCSAVSGLQTPLFVRITRRRQIVVPYQLDSPDKRKYNKTAFLTKLNGILDEDDVSEAESCSSAVSSVTRTTRSRRSKKELQPDTVREAQSEDISDADSCCLSSHVKSSITNRRVTRSMQIKSQAENIKQAEKGNRIVSENENFTENTVKSEPVISDSRPAAELVSDTEDASLVTEDNEEPNSPKSKCAFKSANATQSEDMQEESLNDVTPRSLTEMKQSDSESPEKRAIKNTQSVGADDSEEACGQIQEDYSKILVRVEKLEHMNLSDCMSPKKFLEFQGQMTLNKDKDPECKREDAGTDPQQPFTHADNLGKGEQATEVRSLQKDEAVAQGTDSVSRCGMHEGGVDSAEDQTGGYAEPVPHCSGIPSSENESLALFLSEDESDEFEDSDVAGVDTIEENLYCKEADKRTPSLSKSLETSSLDAEGLFIIDTKPGISSDQKYYLDQMDQGSDAESKHEGSKKGEELSDLEEAEEELIDEDEKEDDDDDLLKNETGVLHLSSSIDPGLNIKKIGGLYISFDAENQKSKSSAVKQLKEKKKDQLLQKSVITPDFEKKECVPPYREALHQLKKQRRAEREKTTGDGWFGMKAPEITTELKNDLKVLKMRASLDPKHFYKKNDRDGLPKYFQVGTVVDSPIDFYHSRIPKKQRRRTIVEELLADSEFRRYNKKKYQEIMSEKAAFAAGKRNRKKKKFHN